MQRNVEGALQAFLDAPCCTHSCEKCSEVPSSGLRTRSSRTGHEMENDMDPDRRGWGGSSPPSTSIRLMNARPTPARAPPSPSLAVEAEGPRCHLRHCSHVHPLGQNGGEELPDAILQSRGPAGGAWSWARRRDGARWLAWLFAGGRPGRPCGHAALRERLAVYGIAPRGARSSILDGSRGRTRCCGASGPPRDATPRHRRAVAQGRQRGLDRLRRRLRPRSAGVSGAV